MNDLNHDATAPLSLSDFIRNASPEEKERIYLEVLQAVGAQQARLLVEKFGTVPPATPVPDDRDAEIAGLKETLAFVERWACHHGTKAHMTAAESLGCIQHHPAIRRITKSYVDGKVPATHDPYAEIAALKAERDALKVDAEIYRWLRSAADVMDGEFFVGVDSIDHCGEWALSGVESDEAIDAAMLAQAVKP